MLKNSFFLQAHLDSNQEQRFCELEGISSIPILELSLSQEPPCMETAMIPFHHEPIYGFCFNSAKILKIFNLSCFYFLNYVKELS